MTEQTKRTPEQIAAKIAEISETIDALTEKRTDLEHELAEALGTGSHKLGDYKVTVKTGTRRLNPEAFKAAYPPEKFPAFYKPAPDLEAARAELGQNKLSTFYGAPGKGSVTVK